jgi:hypothetical protein
MLGPVDAPIYSVYGSEGERPELSLFGPAGLRDYITKRFAPLWDPRQGELAYVLKKTGEIIQPKDPEGLAGVYFQKLYEQLKRQGGDVAATIFEKPEVRKN